MEFDKFLNQAWMDHATDAEAVAARLGDVRAATIEKAGQITLLGNLITHVFGEHLGRWDEGVALLVDLRAHGHASIDDLAALKRFEAILRLAQNGAVDFAAFTPSERARIFAVAASARVGQGDCQTATTWLKQARQFAGSLPPGDPAQRALAVTGNNLAVALEEKSARTAADSEVMVLAAKLALEKWSVAGGWQQISRAHYRMAKSLAQAGRLAEAWPHAEECLKLCEKEKAGAFDRFFAHECLAGLAQKAGHQARLQGEVALMKNWLEQVDEADRSWCQAALDKILG